MCPQFIKIQWNTPEETSKCAFVCATFCSKKFIILVIKFLHRGIIAQKFGERLRIWRPVFSTAYAANICTLQCSTF